MLILLVEDHPVVRAGCRRLLENTPGLTLLEAATTADALRICAEAAPDIVVLDLNLPDGTGFDVVASLRRAHPGTKILIFSMYEDASSITRALDAGARGFVTKNEDPAALLAALDTVARGELYLGQGLAEKLARARFAPAAAEAQAVSEREAQLLDLLADGRSIAEIAAALGVSYRTGAHLAARLRGRLRLRSMAALIRFAVEHRQKVRRSSP